jgi:hypothetical protein
MAEKKSSTSPEQTESSYTHFSGKDAISHVVEAQAKGLIALSEEHGAELPGFLSAFADTVRETAFAALLLVQLLLFFHAPNLIIPVGAIYTLSWLIWKLGRASWLGWARLERLHRLLEQERWEIQHHRQQEREELKALYAAKGFQGRLLEDVLDVLMADGDRLLRVMVQEELGLSLEVHEHPLKQGAGAALGAAFGSLCSLLAAYFGGLVAAFIASLIIIAAASSLTAYYAGNKLIPAITWNIGLVTLAFSTVYFLLQMVGSRT